MKKLRALAQARQQARSAFNAAAGASPTRPTSASPSTAAAAVASPPHTHQDLETELGDDPSPNMEDAKRIADEAMARHSQFLEEIIHESSLADIHIVSPAQPSVPSLAVQETSPIHAPQDLEQQQPPPTPLQQEQQELQTAEYQNATGPAFAAAPVSKAAGKRVSGGKEEATPTIPAPDQAADMSSVAEVSVDGPAPPTLGAPSDAREGLVPAKRTRAAKRNRTKNPARKDSGNSEGGMETQESTLNADGKPILQIPKSNAQRPYMYFTGGNRPAGRLRWSEEETKALMESLDLICALKEEQQVIQPYSIVLRMHGPRGSVSTVLANRNNVQLKDKSRNECLRLKRSGEPVPFWRTTLHTSLWKDDDGTDPPATYKEKPILTQEQRESLTKVINGAKEGNRARVSKRGPNQEEHHAAQAQAQADMAAHAAEAAVVLVNSANMVYDFTTATDGHETAEGFVGSEIGPAAAEGSSTDVPEPPPPLALSHVPLSRAYNKGAAGGSGAGPADVSNAPPNSRGKGRKANVRGGRHASLGAPRNSVGGAPLSNVRDDYAAAGPSSHAGPGDAEHLAIDPGLGQDGQILAALAAYAVDEQAAQQKRQAEEFDAAHPRKKQKLDEHGQPIDPSMTEDEMVDHEI